ncbi:glycosyltransferase family 4 protein [Pirellulimonas nuda]
MPGAKFVIARWLQRLMAEEYGDPASVLIPNGVDRSQFSAPPRDRQRVPTVGFMYGQGWKGGETAVEALRFVQQRFKDLRVVAMTPSHQIKHLRSLVNCVIHYRPAQNLIPTLYRQADCWLLPSTTEGFGMPGLEAAACRCPIVSTRCGGPEDYVIDGVTGHLVPVGDPKAMCDALCRILSLDNAAWRQMSEASYDRSRQFDWDHSAQLLEEALFSRLYERSALDP